jgi:hypothetical protein
MGPALDVPDGRPNRRFIAVATLVAVVVILAVSALLIGVWLVRETVVWLVAAGFLAFSIEPLIRIFTRRGLGRGWATGLAFLVITGVVLFFAIALLPAIVNAAQGLKAAIPGYVEQLQNTGASDSLNADDAIQTAGDTAEGASNFFETSGKVLDLVGGLASAGFAVFMIFTFTLYFLVYGRDLVNGLTGFMPFTYRAPFLDAARRIYKMNTGYWYGKFLIGVIAGLTTFVTMKLLGLPYAVRRDHRPDPEHRGDARHHPRRDRRPARGAVEGRRRGRRTDRLPASREQPDHAEGLQGDGGNPPVPLGRDRDRVHVTLRDRRRAHCRARDQGDRDPYRRLARRPNADPRTSLARAWRPDRPLKRQIREPEGPRI